MPKIPIKIKKGDLAEKVAEEMKVDLLNNAKTEQKQPSNKWLFLTIFLLVVVLGSAAIWFFSAQQKLAFVDLVPENAIVFSIINQQEFYPQVASFNQFLKENNFCGQLPIDKIKQYFKQTDLDFQKNIQPLFKEQMAFIVLPANGQTDFPFVLILEKQASVAKVSQILGKIKQKMKEDCSFSSQIYRQIEITLLKPISASNEYAYSQIGDYLAISNSQESLKKIINIIIGK